MFSEDIPEPPKEIKEKLYLSLKLEGYSAGEVALTTYDPTADYMTNPHHYLVLKTVDYRLEVPEITQDFIRERMLECLNEEKVQVLAENERRLRDVQHRIDALLQVAYQPIEEETIDD